MTEQPIRAIVCGGRDYRDRHAVDRVLTEYGPELVIQGGAGGADLLVREWCNNYKGADLITVFANWRRYGKSAGPRRNQQMVNLGIATHCIAFPGGRGTADMVAKARRAGLEVIEVGNG